MSNGIYRVDKVIATALQNAGFKRVTFGQEGEVDLQKQSIYPLAHMTINSNTQTSSISTFSYEITILDLVDVNSESPRDSLNQMSLTTNIEDVFHDLSYKWSVAWRGIKQAANNQIELPDSVTLNAGYAEVQNKLAGYTIAFEITIPNTPLC